MTKGEAVLTRLAGHVKGNVVAYLALMVAVIGGGGEYAIAATTHPAANTSKEKTATAIVACVSNSSHEMFLHPGNGKCAKGRRKTNWNIKGKTGHAGQTGAPGPTGATGATGAAGAAGTPAPTIFGAVDTDSVIANAPVSVEGWQGLTVSRTGAGVYQVTITDPSCVKANNVLTVTPTSFYAGGQGIPPSGATPVAYLDTNVGGSQFTVNVGYVGSGGMFVPLDYYFNLQDTCQPPSAG